MKYQKIIKDNPILLLLIPALAFFTALVTILKSQWPFGGDILSYAREQALFGAGI